ncbi:hypothetical protein JTB14_022000 [Gonioctena quinquepunctata]|nr:hypothetical protein JTB14_022000 [Gonioctena quinquepunctata]
MIRIDYNIIPGVFLNGDLVNAIMENERCETDAFGELPTGAGDRDCLQRFIEVYESFPELWNKAHPSYSNKYKKNMALEKLLVIFKEMKPNATVKDVTKKLNILRSNFRRELKKIKSSSRSGAGADEVYKPTSWVFYMLKFLEDTESPSILNTQIEETEVFRYRRQLRDNHDYQREMSLNEINAEIERDMENKQLVLVKGLDRCSAVEDMRDPRGNLLKVVMFFKMWERMP